jgi:succinate-semialdehyde dehydrogenase/glutarate-semialdehyde dehydrogenase
MSATAKASSSGSLTGSVPSGLLIAGAWRPAATGATFPVDDPATGEVLCHVADAAEDDAQAAIDAAAAAQEAWAGTPIRVRADLLRAAYDELTRRAEEFALLITREMGKPLAEARAEVAYGADFLRWYSEEAWRIEGRHSAQAHGTGRVLTSQQPVGPCVLITPWNFPLAMATRKLAPAFAAGCTAVLKPAGQTPLTSLLFADLVVGLGLPAGVLNVLTTKRSGPITDTLLDDGRVRKLSFTGSTPVGRHLSRACAERFIRASMELGGNAPLLVFADADLDRAVEGALVAKMRNGGESCIAANRIYVQAPIAEAFADRLAARIAALRVGRGTDEGVDVGPMIDARTVADIGELVDDAVSRGAHVATGGAAIDGPGHFFAPTVLTGVPPDARVLQEEIFGPVAPIVAFEDEDEVVHAANATPYGLVAYVFTQDIDRAMRVADRLDTGMVGVNQGLVSNAAAPFGGVKASGMGREGGHEGLEAYLETKYVAIAGPPAPPAMAMDRPGAGA